MEQQRHATGYEGYKTPSYNRGRTLLLAGILIGIFSRIVIALRTYVPNLSDYAALAYVVFVSSLVPLIYGSLLVLRSKNRHWSYIFMLFSYIIGAFFIMWLPPRRDKNLAKPDTQV
jgi:hypothetical protein